MSLLINIFLGTNCSHSSRIYSRLTPKLKSTLIVVSRCRSLIVVPDDVLRVSQSRRRGIPTRVLSLRIASRGGKRRKIAVENSPHC